MDYSWAVTENPLILPRSIDDEPSDGGALGNS
jgi:hypothetical protein